jgi:hypothetical protein
MANNARDFFKNVSEKLELENLDFIESIPEDLELPENYSDEFHKNYLTTLSAQNNSDVMKHFKAKYLSSADNKLKKGLIESGFSKDEVEEMFLTEPDSLKLIDKSFEKMRELKVDPPEEDKDIEKLKEQYAAKFAEQQKDQLKIENDWKSKVENLESNWKSRYKTSKSNELLSSKKFTSTISDEDAKYLINKNIEESNYLIKMTDDLKFKVYEKDNPDVLVTKEGVEFTYNDVIDKFSEPYLEKNDVTPPKSNTTVVAPPKEGETKGEGRFIQGHAEYGT